MKNYDLLLICMELTNCVYGTKSFYTGVIVYHIYSISFLDRVADGHYCLKVFIYWVTHDMGHNKRKLPKTPPHLPLANRTIPFPSFSFFLFLLIHSLFHLFMGQYPTLCVSSPFLTNKTCK